MDELNTLFWDAEIEDLGKGYIFDDNSNQFTCLVCGESFEKGIIYQVDSHFYEAEKIMRIHINKKHQSMFHYLVNLNKKFTGLTEHQRELLELFYKGFSDQEIIGRIGGGSTATIRNHRFKLKEREKQAKVFLAIMSLLEQAKKSDSKILEKKFVNIHKGATMVDERYNVTEEEREKIISTYFDMEKNVLKQFPSKEKRKIIILQYLTKLFDKQKKYTEIEISNVLKEVYDDFATIRRYLVEYGFLDRNRNGSEYWVKY